MKSTPSKIVISDKTNRNKVTILYCGKIVVSTDGGLYVVDIDMFCGMRLNICNLYDVRLERNGAVFYYHIEGKNVEVEIKYFRRLEISVTVLSAVVGEFDVNLSISTHIGNIPKIVTDFDGKTELCEKASLSKVFLRGETKNVIKFI